MTEQAFCWRHCSCSTATWGWTMAWPMRMSCWPRHRTRSRPASPAFTTFGGVFGTHRLAEVAAGQDAVPADRQCARRRAGDADESCNAPSSRRLGGQPLDSLNIFRPSVRFLYCNIKNCQISSVLFRSASCRAGAGGNQSHGVTARVVPDESRHCTHQTVA
jgi:hypothetical protein